jgi:hypothetical protein
MKHALDIQHRLNIFPVIIIGAFADRVIGRVVQEVWEDYRSSGENKLATQKKIQELYKKLYESQRIVRQYEWIEEYSMILVEALTLSRVNHVKRAKKEEEEDLTNALSRVIQTF